EGAQLFTKHEQLDQRVRRLLGAERRGIFGFGLSLFAMTGKARGGTLGDRLRVDGSCDQGERQSRDYFTHYRSCNDDQELKRFRHCEMQSDEAIQLFVSTMDCF